MSHNGLQPTFLALSARPAAERAFLIEKLKKVAAARAAYVIFRAGGFR